MALGQPVAGEAGYDAAADNGDQHDIGGNGEAARQGRVIVGDDQRVKADIGQRQGGHGGQYLEIAPFFPGDDLAQANAEQQHQEGAVDEDGERQAQQIGGDQHQPPCQPHDE